MAQIKYVVYLTVVICGGVHYSDNDDDDAHKRILIAGSSLK